MTDIKNNPSTSMHATRDMKKIQNSDQIETWQTTRKTKKKAETIKIIKN
jgi:hypothetical protein